MRRTVLALSVALGGMTAAGPAHANGAYTHIYISQLARQALPEGPIRALLDDPAAMLACERGSMFPDSGYAAQDAYGEFAHWEPFHGPVIADLRARYGGDYGSEKARLEVAFLLGMTSHGLADQVYDTTLLARAFEVDGPEPEGVSVDQYADYFVIVVHGVELTTTAGGPFPELTAVLRSEMARDDLGVDVLEDGMSLMTVALNAQKLLARGAYLTAWQSFPWLGTHVHNAAARGSVPWLAAAVARHWQAVWARLHGTDDPDAHMVVQTHPPDGAENFPVDGGEHGVFSRIGVIFGYGVRASETFDRISLVDDLGNDVPLVHGSPYGGQERSYLFARPEQPLGYDTHYTARIAAGVVSLGGETTTEEVRFTFRTRCADDRLADCPPLEAPLVTGEIPTSVPEPPAEEEPAAPAAPMVGGETGCQIAPGPQPGSAAWLLLLAAWLRRRAREAAGARSEAGASTSVAALAGPKAIAVTASPAAPAPTSSHQPTPSAAARPAAPPPAATPSFARERPPPASVVPPVTPAKGDPQPRALPRADRQDRLGMGGLPASCGAGPWGGSVGPTAGGDRLRR